MASEFQESVKPPFFYASAQNCCFPFSFPFLELEGGKFFFDAVGLMVDLSLSQRFSSHG